jgi:alpha-1,3-glucosyltransferase
VHSYWAPNFWAIYAFADRVALKLLSGGDANNRGAGTTRGRVDSAAGFIALLPEPTPAVCATLSLAAMAPSLYVFFAVKDTRAVVLPAFAHAALSAFAFGWHVHEK